MAKKETKHKYVALIADDSSTARRMLTKELENFDFEVIEAENGQAAWNAILKMPTCDLIISDFNMPQMNGLEFLKNVKNTPKLKDIPCFILSTVGAEAEGVLAIAKKLGVMAWLTKPVQAEQIEILVRKIKE
jgi:two-component system chemotaxis response regulator CheY